MNGTVTYYTHDLNNRLISETDGTYTKSYTYDNNSNMLSWLRLAPSDDAESGLIYLRNRY